MAPRGRPKKKPGSRRIDAAYAALGPFGFPKRLVRKTVDRLLKVYGGDDGWPFIEEASYRLLIDAVLEAQQQDDDGKSEEGGDDSRTPEVREKVTETGIETYGQPSGLNLQGENLAATLGEVEKQCIFSSDASPSILPQLCEQPCLTSPSPTLPATSTISSPLKQSANSCPSVSLQTPTEPIRRRPPCYGWISESESEEEVAPGGNVETRGRERRPSGWNAKPICM